MAASRLGETVVGMLLDPDRDKGLDIGRQLLPAGGPVRVGELAKLPEQGHPTEDIPRCVAVLMEPRHIALNRLTEPGGAQAIDRLRFDKIAFEHALSLWNP